ncbi:hypothetical protein TruAng_000994 [Truncatella angustata]|nr:hypothetical protein TruAng_000994 [Truncatella angustata]
MLGVEIHVVTDDGKAVAIMVGHPTRYLPDEDWTVTMIDTDRMRTFARLVDSLKECERQGRFLGIEDDLRDFLREDMLSSEKYIKTLEKRSEDREIVGMDENSDQDLSSIG